MPAPAKAHRRNSKLASVDVRPVTRGVPREGTIEHKFQPQLVASQLEHSLDGSLQANQQFVGVRR